MKNLKFLFLFLLSFAIISCSKDNNDGAGGIKLTVSAVNSTASKTFTSQKTQVAEVIFTDFRISIRDVIFKNDDDPNSSLDTDEIQFRGPYQIDLLNNSNALSQTIGNAFVPDGRYKELRFKFHKDEDLPATDDLFDRSIYIEGTIDGVPFVFWHDTSENLDLGRSTGVLVQDGIVNFTVQFDISQFLSSLNQIDLSQATDNNGDGLIEIFPNDQDGNQDIADALKDNIKFAADLMN
ncbi:MAG: DUF4382 domain-containing protein [Flavobacteriaceae bacterium]|nr:DUF4382 domain-containing protein [Flavobacteriaceae bacterium]